MDLENTALGTNTKCDIRGLDYFLSRGRRCVPCSPCWSLYTRLPDVGRKGFIEFLHNYFVACLGFLPPAGPIPPELGNLTALHGLALFTNQLGGERTTNEPCYPCIRSTWCVLSVVCPTILPWQLSGPTLPPLCPKMIDILAFIVLCLLRTFFR